MGEIMVIYACSSRKFRSIKLVFLKLDRRSNSCSLNIFSHSSDFINGHLDTLNDRCSQYSSNSIKKNPVLCQLYMCVFFIEWSVYNDRPDKIEKFWNGPRTNSMKQRLLNCHEQEAISSQGIFHYISISKDNGNLKKVKKEYRTNQIMHDSKHQRYFK